MRTQPARGSVRRRACASGLCALALALSAASAGAQAGGGTTTAAAATVTAAADSAEYVIGPDDVLGIVFWRDKDLSADAVVRPDGKISLPLLNDVQAAGLTPSRLRAQITEAARRFVDDPNVTVVVRQINSRKVFVTGEIVRPGSYPLAGRTTVLQMIAIAGGLKEYADAKNIMVMRVENNRTVNYPFNYHDVSKGRGLRQNLELRPGDTIVVP